ncbi:MAG: hypothetical protein JWO83_524 [Caulobacteraceae bacterium]|nr:hypothetical protein [Caulobacteraceae bacterium]
MIGSMASAPEALAPKALAASSAAVARDACAVTPRDAVISKAALMPERRDIGVVKTAPPRIGWPRHCRYAV